MRAGKLRHKVAIQEFAVGSPQQKPSGEPDGVWADVDGLSSISASIEPLKGRELFAAQEHHSEVEVRVRIRYRAGITAAMRVAHGGLYYDIVAVLDPELRHVELELLCKQGVTSG